MAMPLVLLESTRGRPGVGNLRYAADERACFAASKAAAWVGSPGKCLGFTSEGGVERSHRGCNVRKETVIVIHHPQEPL